MSPFWLRVYNIPIELMDHQTALDIGNAIGDLVAIDWKDRNRGWTEFMRLKVKINVLKPLRRVVKLVDKDGLEMIGLLKYERLPDFCYECRIIGHTVKKCTFFKEGKEKGGEEGSISNSPLERKSYSAMRDGLGRFKSKRKRHRGSNGENTDESPARL
ncbi:hypothetical protein Goarm_009928, partial [Gossypium armourianum]|nr:hypothetical protein [Gossypium armourianum]